MKIEYASVLGYLNMKEMLKNYPQLTDYAIEAAKRAGIKAEFGQFAAVPTVRG